MEYRQLGRSGLTVSVVGLGCNNFGGARSSEHVAAYGALDLDQTRAVVDTAFDAGVTFLDTANIYGKGGSERFLGEILKDRRDEVVIGTKWGGGEPAGVAWGSRRYIRRALEGSLRRLDTDFIDLYQLHWPDPLTPLEETLAALDELVHEGKLRYVGSSHFAAWEVVDADWTARSRGYERMISAQNHYNLLERDAEKELIPACVHVGVGLLPYFPLASGLLTGKYRRNGPAPQGARLAGREISAATFDRLEALEGFAHERGHTLLELAIAGLAVRPAVASVITGATSPSQILANVAAAEWRLGPDDLTALDGLGASP
jgi:aryl-alcohol dehydrogenase-like predicted oxidoreductase